MSTTKRITFILLSIIFLAIWALAPYTAFSPWRDWFDTYDPKKKYRCLPLASMAYYNAPRFLFELANQTTEARKTFKDEWQLEFLLSLMRGQAKTIVPGGILTPKMLCESLVPDSSPHAADAILYGDYVRIKNPNNAYIGGCGKKKYYGIEVTTRTGSTDYKSDVTLFQVKGDADGSPVFGSFSLLNQSKDKNYNNYLSHYKQPHNNCSESLYLTSRSDKWTVSKDLNQVYTKYNVAVQILAVQIYPEKDNTTWISSICGKYKHPCTDYLGLTDTTIVGDTSDHIWIIEKDKRTPSRHINWPTDINNWKRIFEIWGQSVSSDGTWIKDHEKWENDDNFLFNHWGIPYDSPLVEGFVTNKSISKDGVKLYPAAMEALLGKTTDGIGGWYGFIRNGNWESINDVKRYIWSDDIPEYMSKSSKSKENKCNAAGIAQGAIGLGMGAGFAAAAIATGPVGWIVGIAVLAGAAGGGLLSASSEGCI